MHATVHKFVSAICYLEGGGHCDMKGASRRRLPPPLSTEWWRQLDCLRFCFRENQYFPAVRRLVYFQSLGDTLIIYKGNQVSLRPPKFTLANIYALVIWQSFNYLHQGGCFFWYRRFVFSNHLAAAKHDGRIMNVKNK